MKIKGKNCISSSPSCQILPFQKLHKVPLSSIISAGRAASAAILPTAYSSSLHPAEMLADGPQPPDRATTSKGYMDVEGIDANPKPAQGEPAPHHFPQHLSSCHASPAPTCLHLLTGSESSPATSPVGNHGCQVPGEPHSVLGCPSGPADATAGASISWGPPTARARDQGELSPHSCCPRNEPQMPLRHSLASTGLYHFDLFRAICLHVSALLPSQPQHEGAGLTGSSGLSPQ